MKSSLKKITQLTLSLALAGLFSLSLFLGEFPRTVPIAYAAGETCFATIDGTTVYSSTTASALRDAVAAAGNDDTIKIAGTCAGVQQSAGITQTVYISQNLTLRGGYTTTTWNTSDPDTNPTVLDAQSLGRVIYISTTYTVTLDSLTLQNGRTSTNGGGIYAGGSLTLTNSLLTHNWADDNGGGLYAAGGSGSTVISNTQIISNTGYSRGGGGFYAAQPITISNSLISQNATTDCGAGGWLKDNPHFLIENSDIISNTGGSYGGGLCIYPNSQGEIRGTRLLSNTAATYGGGIYLEDTITLSVTDSELAYNINDGGDGGGIHAYTNSNLTLQDSRVHHNTANGNGGGIYAEDNVMLSVVNSELSYNTSTNTYGGGGLYLYESHAQVQNSTLSHNQARTGGGIYATNMGSNSSLITLTHTTLVSNTGVITGGGIYLSDSNNADAYIIQATMQNSIIAGNGSADCVTANGWEVLDASPGYNLDSDGTCIAGGGTGNITSANLGLGPLQDNGGDTETHALLDGSPALDVIPVVSGSCNNSGVITDQRGISRPQKENCDIGAVEQTTIINSVYLPIVVKDD